MQNEKSVSGADRKFEIMTTQPVKRLIARLALPTMISMLVTTFYNLADTLFVRQLENDSMVAAVGIVLPLMSIIQAFGFFAGHGSGNYISRALGRRDRDDAEIMAATGFVYAVSFGVLICVLGLIFRNPLAWLLGAGTNAAHEATVSYMTYILIGAPFMTAAIVLNNQLRMQGNAFFAMIGLTSGAVINILLDPFLIYRAGDAVFGGAIVIPFGAGMGVGGAALATVLSQMISLALLLVGMVRSDNIKIRIRAVSGDPKYLRGIAEGGLPSLARQGLASVAGACLNHAVILYLAEDTLVDAAQAALTGASKIMQFLSSALIGFGQGFQPVCGFNYGAKRYARVREAYWFCVWVSATALTLLATVGYFCAEPIAHAVAGTSPEAARIAASALRAQLITIPLTSWVILCNMMLQNMGMTVPATIVAAARQGLSFVPCVLILPLLFSRLVGDPLTGILLAQPAADLLALAISLPIGISVLRKLKRGTV